MFTQRSALVHSIDPGSKTFTVIQQFENGIERDYGPWAGTVDVVGFDIYPCSKAQPTTCDFAAIDKAITAIAGAGITNYWAVVQDFQDCYYRLPTAPELRVQFDHWSHSNMSGYFVFSWNYQSANATCPGTSLDSHPDHLAELKFENSRTFSPPRIVDTAKPAGATAPPLWAIGAAALAAIALLAVVARRRWR
jgi:hypothetical protein